VAEWIRGQALTEPTTDTDDFGRYAPAGLVQSLMESTRKAGSSWGSRRMAFVMRRLAIRLLHGMPVDTEVLGARMRLYPYKNVCEKRILFTPQFFDPNELGFLKAHLTEKFVFLDIGSNIGGYALFVAAHAGPAARIVAAEPQPDIYKRLTYNIRLNPFATIKAVDCAVADKDGMVTLFIDAQNKGESSVKIMSNATAQSIQVPSKRLLTLIQEEGFSHVDAIKLDTEGAEDLILETFFKEADPSLWPRILILERGASRWHVDLPQLLGTKGYRPVEETRNNVIFKRDIV
jgi:FkbM family methyltransferase